MSPFLSPALTSLSGPLPTLCLLTALFSPGISGPWRPPSTRGESEPGAAITQRGSTALSAQRGESPAAPGQEVHQVEGAGGDANGQ